MTWWGNVKRAQKVILPGPRLVGEGERLSEKLLIGGDNTNELFAQTV